MVFQHLQDCCSHMRVTAINLTVQWSCRQQRRVLPELATLVCNDPDPLVRSAAINVTAQFFIALVPDLQLRYIQALAEAIDKDPDPLERSAAINATGLVLPALAKAIYDFENPQFQEDAASAVINISKNYPRDTLTPDLVEIVRTLLEFRSREDIASDQTRILAIENLLKQFQVKQPPDTWASTWSQLLDHQEELLKILAHKEDQEEST